MNLLFILIGIGLAAFVILVSYKSISQGIKAKSKLKEHQSSKDEVNDNYDEVDTQQPTTKNAGENSWAHPRRKGLVPNSNPTTCINVDKYKWGWDVLLVCRL